MQNLIQVFYKILSIVSKSIFVLYFAVDFNDGILSEFLYVTTMSSVVATILGLGMADHYPIYLNRNPNSYHDFMRRVLPRVIFINSFLFCLYIVLDAGSIFIKIILLAVILVSYVHVSGVFRFVSYKYYESLSNLPAIVFIIVLSVSGFFQFNDLVGNFAFSYLLALILISFRPYLKSFRVKNSSFRPGIEDLKAGLYKMLSEVFALIAMRSVVMLPPLLTGSMLSDKVALMFMIAEAISLLIQIFINKVYLAFVKFENSSKYFMRFNFLIIFIFFISKITASFIIYFNIDVDLLSFSISMLDVSLLFEIVCYFIIFNGFSLFRYFLWANDASVGKVDLSILFMFVVMFSNCAFVGLFGVNFSTLAFVNFALFVSLFYFIHLILVRGRIVSKVNTNFYSKG